MAFLTLLLRLLLAAGCLGSWGVASAQLGEGDLKAAFVFNFAKFVEWPAVEAQGAPNGHFVLCQVGGDDTLLAALPRLEGKAVQGREIRVRAVQARGDSVRACQILVIGESEAARAGELARLATMHGVLSVSAVDQFVEAGGMIGLVTVDNRVHFEINLDATQKANLKLAAQFVKLARKVKR